VAEVVQHDLEGSGRFRALRVSACRPQPTRADEIAAPLWKGRGSDYVVSGACSAMDSGQVALDFDLVNTLTGARRAAALPGRRCARNAAHR